MTTGAKPGRQIAGRYDLKSSLGEGGMATVWLARDTVLGRDVAVKLLRPELAKNAELVNRFKSEATAAAKMTHPSIVKVFDAGTDRSDGAASKGVPQPYIVMEHVPGTLLRDKINGHPLPVDEAISIVSGILTALTFSHKAGVVHRDIKPGNIMITDNGGVKVMDFGIARAANEAGRSLSENDAILGSALYFSPEQAKGLPVDARSDLYSTGVVLFELLTGRPPFLGETPVAIAYQHLSEPVPPLRALNPEVPANLQAVVAKAMAKQPASRYRSAEEFQAALDEAVQASGRKGRAARVEEPTGRILFGIEHEDGARAVEQLAARAVTAPPTQKGPPVAWLWAGILVLAAMVVGMVFWISNLQTGPIDLKGVVEVPNLVGHTEHEARTQLDAKEASYDIQFEPHDTLPEGTVIRTDPLAGERIHSNFRIQVVVSSGPQKATVPNLANVSLSTAKARLEAAGLKLGQTKTSNSASIAQNRVISSTPAAGELLPIGSTVDLVLSTGRVRLPNLVGKSLADAMAEITKLDLTPNPVGNTNCSIKSGTPVISQSPGAGNIKQRSKVTITYCVG